MILVELTINNTVHRYSDDFLKLEHFWDAKVTTLTSVQVSMPKFSGGYVSPVFGSISFVPSIVEDEISYPVSCPIKIMHTFDFEVDATLIFEGTAHIKTIGRTDLVFELYGRSFEQLATDATYSGTLIEVFDNACDPTGTDPDKLPLKFDSTHARIPSPNVDYVSSGENYLIDNLTDISSFFTHSFHIIEDTLYLIDLLGFTKEENVTEFDFLPSTYTYPSPVSLFKTGEDTKEITVTNDYSYGKELSVSPTCASVEAEIIEALENVKTIYNRQQAQLIFPFEQVYTPGTKLNLKDVSQILPIVGSVNVRSITINFDTFEYVIQGDMI
jgi:hypothetical protein